MEFVSSVALASVLVLIPGPAVTLVMKQSLLKGKLAAFHTAMGVFSADLVWVAASVVGLTALIVASQPMFPAQHSGRCLAAG